MASLAGRWCGGDRANKFTATVAIARSATVLCSAIRALHSSCLPSEKDMGEVREVSAGHLDLNNLIILAFSQQVESLYNPSQFLLIFNHHFPNQKISGRPCTSCARASGLLESLPPERSPGLMGPLRKMSEMLATQRNDPRRKAICFLQILLLVALNH
jgi:hypothetical protein